MPRRKKTVETDVKTESVRETNLTAEELLTSPPESESSIAPEEDFLTAMISDAVKGAMGKYQQKAKKDLEAKDKVIEELQEKLKKAEKALSEKQTEMNAFAEASKKAILDAKEENEKTIQEIKEENEKKIEDAKETNNKEIQFIKEENEKKLQEVKEENEKKLQTLKAAQNVENLVPTKELLQMIREFLRTAENFVKEKENNPKLAFESLCKEYEDTLNRLEGEIVSGEIIFSHVQNNKSKKEDQRRIVYSSSEHAWKVEVEKNGHISKISDMINDLAYECYNAKVPIIICCQYTKNGKEEIIKKVLSPAAVDYKPDNPHLIYDLMCVLSGNFETTPKQSKEEEIDPFAIESDMEEI